MSLRFWHVIVFLLALAIFAIARAPAGVFAPQRPGVFTYDRAEGTIWRAHFVGAQFGAYEAGAVDWRLSFVDLLQGKAVADLDFAGGAFRGSVRLLGNWRGDRRIVAEDVTIEGAPLGQTALLAGTTHIRGLDLFFADGRCATALGNVESDVLARNAELFRWRGPNVAGAASCVGEEAVIVLEGGETTDFVHTRLALRANGEGEWRAEARTSRPEVVAALAASGFQRDAETGVMSAAQEMRWLPF